MIRAAWIFVLSAGLYSTIPIAVADTGMRLGSIDGAKTLEIRNQNQKRQGGTGEALKPGDKIETGKKITATLLNPDGSVLLIGREGKIEIQESPDAPAALQIQSGTLRGIVSKIDRSSSGALKKKFRLFIRTHSAVMGVRGTDFVISADPTKDVAQLHTLEGTVEVAKTEQVLVEKGGIPVRGGEAVKASPERIEEPQIYDQARFAEEMKATQPELYVPVPTPSSAPASDEVFLPVPGQPLLKDTKECRDDVGRLCGDERGLFRVGQCMLQHADQLAPQCKILIQSRRGRRLNACRDEIQKYCLEARGAYGKCLVKHEAQLSAGCKKEIEALLNFRNQVDD